VADPSEVSFPIISASSIANQTQPTSARKASQTPVIGTKKHQPMISTGVFRCAVAGIEIRQMSNEAIMDRKCWAGQIDLALL